MHNPVLGTILMILGGIIFLAVSYEFLYRAMIAAFGLYLVYQGMIMRGQWHNARFTFGRFRNRF